MLDAQFVADNLEAVRQNCVNRNVKADVDRVPALVAERKAFVRQVQDIQAKQNELQKSTGKEKDPAKRQTLIDEGRALRGQVGELEAKQKHAEDELRTVLRAIPNMSHPDAPVGTDAAANKIIRKWGEPAKFNFK